MPGFFQDALNEIRNSMETPTPPGFAPIAGILLPDSYKSDLSRIIKSAPDDLLENREWWNSLRKATGAKYEDLKKVHEFAKQAASQKRTNALDAIKKFAAMPQVKDSKVMQQILGQYASQAQGGKADPKDLLKMQEIIAGRLKKLDDRLAKMRTQRERFAKDTKDPGKPQGKPQDTKGASGTGVAEEGVLSQEEAITEEVLVENLLGDVVSKMSSFFASPQLAKIMAGERGDKKMIQQLAKASVYSVLQLMTDKAYQKLESAGLERRLLMKAYKNRDKDGNAEILDKAAKILGSKKRFTPPPVPKEAKPKKDDIVDAEVVSPEEQGIKFGDVKTKQPPVVKKSDNPVEDEVNPPKVAPVQEEDPIPADDPAETPEKKPEELSVGAQIYRKVMAAAKAAKAQGQDPAAVADYILKQYEEQKIPDAAIVRRMFERSKLRSL